MFSLKMKKHTPLPLIIKLSYFALFLLLNVLITMPAFAQKATIELHLDDVIERAQQNAPEVRMAKARLERSRMTYNDRMIDFKPTLSLDAQLPIYNRSTYPVTQPDGTQLFRRNHFNNDLIFYQKKRAEISVLISQTRYI